MAPNHRHFSVTEAEQAGDLTEQRIDKLVRRPDSELYAVAPHVYRPLPFLLVAAAGLWGLVRLRRAPVHRHVVAAAVVILSVIVPYTAFILGRGITPFHLWRVLWFAPFGLAAAALLTPLQERARRSPAASVVLPWAACALLLLGVGLRWRTLSARLDSLRLPPRWDSALYDVGPRGQLGARVDYAVLSEMGATLSALPPNTVVAGDAQTNDLIPCLSARARPFFFRNPTSTSLTGGFGKDESQARYRDWRALLADDTELEERLSVASRYRVHAVLVGTPGADWAANVGAPALVRESARAAGLVLYVLDPR
jgi:hypothetical protein